MLTEREMENLIVKDPEKYLEEAGLRLLSRQFRIGNYRFDLLFEDRHGAKLIVEIQKGTLDRAHTYKILDYYDEYKERHPKDFIELMIVANKIPEERKRRLTSHGISFKEVLFSDSNIGQKELVSNEGNKATYHNRAAGGEKKKIKRNKLGHGVNTQGGRLDALLIEGCDLKVMASKLIEEGLSERDDIITVKRIITHINHLKRDHGIIVVKDINFYKIAPSDVDKVI